MYRIKVFFRTIYKFFYYGYYGTKTVAYDANSVDILILVHMKEVQKFMKSDKTYLMWNSKERQNKGLMRKLNEFVELCTRKYNRDDFNNHYYFSEVRKKYGNPPIFGNFKRPAGYDKDIRMALKKDRIIAKQLEDRYYEMYRKYLPGFWD